MKTNVCLPWTLTFRFYRRSVDSTLLIHDPGHIRRKRDTLRRDTPIGPERVSHPLSLIGRIDRRFLIYKTIRVNLGRS
ncbi:Hypothetical predicted protein [Marmota monax]|uniref:Uncharacterized protein n=1 Tax=Marmota monax TaxID=9995 RepID=A0A5E4BST4_MARMO|nr:Hypothetical predicted protein [Marmota monax]